MNIVEQKMCKIPSYYPQMYMDGFTPEEILYARQKLIREKELARKNAKNNISEEQILQAVEKNLESAVDKALNDIFKGWK